VQRRQLGQAQAALQARQQGVAGIAAHRRHRQEVRLVHHHQALVQVQQLLGEGMSTSPATSRQYQTRSPGR
jgi:hypothetical protein